MSNTTVDYSFLEEVSRSSNDNKSFGLLKAIKQLSQLQQNLIVIHPFNIFAYRYGTYIQNCLR